MERDRDKIQFVFDYIYKEMGISEYEIKSKIRKREVIDARRLFFYIMRNYFQYGFEKIGKITLNTHATVLHSCKVFNNYIAAYPKLTILPYKDVCFQLDLMKGSVEEQCQDMKEKIILINKQLDKIITIKQLQNGRRKELHSE
tara:strand:+ start:338 stop:766 length:429 start_codon:yes stop_codon:yes gene_type:complete